jgi:hypothetical protein
MSFTLCVFLRSAPAQSENAGAEHQQSTRLTGNSGIRRERLHWAGISLGKVEERPGINDGEGLGFS